jgi:hypothetical protein
MYAYFMTSFSLKPISRRNIPALLEKLTLEGELHNLPLGIHLIGINILTMKRNDHRNDN